MSSPPAVSKSPSLGLDDDHSVVPCRSPKIAVAVMCATVAFVYGSGTILFSALSVVASELDASQTQLQWITGTYPLVIAALLLPGGAFVDRVGRKVGAVAGLAITSGCFLAATQTTDARLVIVCMGLAGIGGAMSFPATLATIAAVLPRERRGPAVALWTVSLFMGGMVGTSLGGVLSEYVSWQWLLVPAVIAGLAIIVPALIWVPESRDIDNAHVDLRGAVLSVLAVGLFVFGMTEAPTRGWTDPLTLTAVLGVAFAGLFVWSQLAASRPLLDVRLFKDGRFAAGSLFNLLSWFMVYGCFFIAVQYRAYTLGYGPLMAGLSFGPAALCIPLGMAGPRLARRYGSRPVMISGLLVLALGSAVIALTATSQEYWPVVIGELIAFCGLALAGGPATESIIDALPPAKHGVASAVNDITRQLGIALGVALLGSLFNLAYRADVTSGGGVTPDALEATKSSAVQGLDLAAGLPVGLREAQVSTIEHAVAWGYVIAMCALAVTMLVGAYAVWRLCPAGVGRQDWVAPPQAGAVLPDPLPAAPAPAPQPWPVGAELVTTAAHYQRLLRDAQSLHDDLEARIQLLGAHETEIRRRCKVARDEHSAVLAERVRAAQAEWREWTLLEEPVAGPSTAVPSDQAVLS